MKLFSVPSMTFLIITLMITNGISVTMEKNGINTSYFKKYSLTESGKYLLLPQETKDRGIGPVKELKLGPLNGKMVLTGKGLFNNKCLICHDLDQKKIGPPLRDITKIRTPEFIMNLLLNTTQMQEKDPIIKELIITYKVPMTPPYFSNEQARSVLEYLRSVVK